MDEKFSEFEAWYLKQEKEWESQRIVIDYTGLGEHGHQYWIKLHSENGLGNIVLYESNGLYWVDFEGGNYDYDVMFMKGGIDFVDESSLENIAAEFIKHITWDGSKLIKEKESG